MKNESEIYKCKHFNIKELVSESIYNKRGEKAWELLDERALISLDAIRDAFGSTIVNNWSTGGPREWSGLRTPDSKYYSSTSQHSYGRAFDCIFKNRTPEQVRSVILNNPDNFPYITGIELNVSWLHFDVRNTTKIKTFTAG